jgi:hypothetical protein
MRYKDFSFFVFLRKQLYLLFIICFFASSLFFSSTNGFAQKPENKDEKNEHPKTSTVRGKVIYEDTGNPVRYIRLQLIPLGGQERKPGEYGPRWITMTDSKGEFEIKSVPIGNYAPLLYAPGLLTLVSYTNLEEDLEKQKPDSYPKEITKNFETISVAAEKDITTVTVKAKRGGAINGKVTYADGEPAISVRISIKRKVREKFVKVMAGSTSMSVFGATTDDKGCYRISGLMSGDYIISVSQEFEHGDSPLERNEDAGLLLLFPSGSLLETYYQNATNEKSATEIKVIEGQETNDINLTLPDKTLYRVSGNVVSGIDGKPISGAIVTLRPKRLSREGRGDVNFRARPFFRTDGEGRWFFKDIPDSEYIVSVDPIYGFLAEKEKDEDGSTKYKKSARKEKLVTVAGSNVEQFKLEVNVGATVKGFVTDEKGKFSENLRGLLEILNVSEEGLTYDDTQSLAYDGTFTVEGLSTGDVYLSVSLFEDNKHYIKSMSQEGKDLLRQPLHVEEGETINNVKIVLGNDAGTLKGKVEKEGKAVAGVGVLLVPTDTSRWRVHLGFLYAATDASGLFKVTGAPGEYFAIILGSDDSVKQNALYEVRRDWLQVHTVNAQRVSIKPNKAQTIMLKLSQ